MIYPKAIYNFTATLSGDYLIIALEYVENYNEADDTYDNRPQIVKTYHKNNVYSCLEIDIKLGTNTYYEVGDGKSMIKIGLNEYVWYQGQGAMVDPSFFDNQIKTALGI